MRAIAIAIWASLACGADLKVDHITVAGNDLQRLRDLFAAIGIETEFGGKHANGETQMALASFGDGSYLELIGPQPGANVAPHYWSAFMLNNAGPCAWAIRSEDLSADAARLKAAGVGVRRQRNGRTRPDGVELKWETADAEVGPPGSFFPFLIHDETPRENRVYPHGKPAKTKVSDVRFVVIAVRDLDAAVAKYRAAFGLGEPQRQIAREMGAKLAWFPGTPVVLAGASGKNTWVAERLKQFGEAPCAFVLTSDLAGRGKPAAWFSKTVVWLNLGGMRIGVSP